MNQQQERVLMVLSLTENDDEDESKTVFRFVSLVLYR